MIKKLKSFIFGIVGVFTGIIIVSLIRDGEIDWSSIGALLIFLLLILLFVLGLNLYKTRG